MSIRGSPYSDPRPLGGARRSQGRDCAQDRLHTACLGDGGGTDSLMSRTQSMKPKCDQIVAQGDLSFSLL